MTTPGIPRDPQTIDVLLAQYRLLEERRAGFGREFMQTIGFVGGGFGLVIGLLGGESSLLLPVLRTAGAVFLLLAFLAHRLGKRQDDCQAALARVETLLEGALGTDLVPLPHAAKSGARFAIVIALLAAGVSLLAAPLYV